MSEALEFGREDFIKTIFGRQDRLAVWGLIRTHEIDPPQYFYSAGLGQELGIPFGIVYRELETLETLGAVEPAEILIPHTTQGRKINLYVRSDPEFWEGFVDPILAYTDRWYPE